MRVTRVQDECRYPLDDAESWICPQCIRGRGSSADHTMVPGECRLADERYRGRPSRGLSHARDPRIRAAGSAGAGESVGPGGEDDPFDPYEDVAPIGPAA